MQTVNLKKYYYPLFVKDTFVEVSDEVAEAMGDLTDTQARRIRARYVLGKKLTEIAAEEGVSVSVVQQTIKSALKRMRRYFEKKKWRK